MPPLDRITFAPNRMGGKPSIRDMRVTAGTIGLIASNATPEGSLADCPYLGPEDIKAARSYAG